ncbi:hypothetical protein SFUMM280S_03108 [Streptomyces fumanus]
MAAGLLAVHRQRPRAAQLGCAVPYGRRRHRVSPANTFCPFCKEEQKRSPLPAAEFARAFVPVRNRVAFGGVPEQCSFTKDGQRCSGPATARNCAPRTTPSGEPHHPQGRRSVGGHRRPLRRYPCLPGSRLPAAGPVRPGPVGTTPTLPRAPPYPPGRGRCAVGGAAAPVPRPAPVQSPAAARAAALGGPLRPAAGGPMAADLRASAGPPHGAGPGRDRHAHRRHDGPADVPALHCRGLADARPRTYGGPGRSRAVHRHRADAGRRPGPACARSALPHPGWHPPPQDH